MTFKEEFLQSCLILDTETTGTDTNTVEIIESGFVIRDNGEWSMFQELHKPIKTPIPPLVEAITYITNEMVEDNIVSIGISKYVVGNLIFDSLPSAMAHLR